MTLHAFRVFIFSIMIPYPITRFMMYFMVALGLLNSFTVRDAVLADATTVILLVAWLNVLMHIFLILTNPKDPS